ncbi:MAG: XrtA-associated ATPase [Alphaproteobacteria bacterium]|nr:XrtA-associated ATPase [Alphaproteobacteria bacterium]
MYTSFYHFSSRPFQLSPNHRFFFGSKGHRRAMAYLTYGLHQREGLIVVTGDVGTGKTTLVDYLAEQLSVGPFVAGRVSAGKIEPSNVLPLVARAFQLPASDRDQAELQKDIETFLIARNKARQRPLLVIDEAQNWPLSALEELRMLANLQHGGKALVQIVLVGQPQFRDALTGEDYEQLRQRVVASHHLENLDDTEVGPYIEHRLKQVGWQGDPTFDADACALIFEHTNGVPRRINLVCSRLLVLGALEQRHMIDAEAVEEVLEELDQEGAPYEPAGPAEPGGDARAQERAASQETGGPPPNDPARHGKGMNGKALNGTPVDPEAFDIDEDHWGDVEHWRREAVRLLHKLEQTNDDLAGERRRVESIRLEADQLRDKLHKVELEQTRAQAEAARRSAAAMARTAPARASIFRRFGGN